MITPHIHTHSYTLNTYTLHNTYILHAHVHTHITLLFGTAEERRLRLHASLPATPLPRHACTCHVRVSAERVVQPFFVPYKNAGLQFQLSLWSCVRFKVCLGMIFTTWLKKAFIYRAVQDVLARVAFLGRNRECFVRTDIAVSESVLRMSCRPSLLSVKTRVYCFSFFVVMCSFQGLSGNDICHMTKEDFRLLCCARCFSSCSFSWEKSWMFCENWHRCERVRVSCRPSLLSVKTQVYCTSCFVVMCSFQNLSENDIHYMTEGDFSFIVLCKKF